MLPSKYPSGCSQVKNIYKKLLSEHWKVICKKIKFLIYSKNSLCLGLGENGGYTSLTNQNQQAGQRSLPPSPADSGS